MGETAESEEGDWRKGGEGRIRARIDRQKGRKE